MQTVADYVEDIIDNFEKRMANQGDADKVDPFWLHGLRYHAKEIDKKLNDCKLDQVIGHCMRFGFNQQALNHSMVRKGVEGTTGDLMFKGEIITNLVAQELWNNCGCTRNSK